MIDILPKVAAAVSQPLSKTEKIIFVGGGGQGGGPSAFTREMERVIAEVPETVQALTGIDLRRGMQNMMNEKTLNSIMDGGTQGIAEGYARSKVMKSGK